jgi:hypothetical protein
VDVFVLDRKGGNIMNPIVRNGLEYIDNEWAKHD